MSLGFNMHIFTEMKIILHVLATKKNQMLLGKEIEGSLVSQQRRTMHNHVDHSVNVKF